MCWIRSPAPAIVVFSALSRVWRRNCSAEKRKRPNGCAGRKRHFFATSLTSGRVDYCPRHHRSEGGGACTDTECMASQTLFLGAGDQHVKTHVKTHSAIFK